MCHSVLLKREPHEKEFIKREIIISVLHVFVNCSSFFFFLGLIFEYGRITNSSVGESYIAIQITYDGVRINITCRICMDNNNKSVKLLRHDFPSGPEIEGVKGIENLIVKIK